jgi:ferrous iron transport protein A
LEGAFLTLDELNLEEPARVSEVGGQGALRRRLLDMGITPGTEVMIRKRAPMGDPIEIHLRGYELTLRIEDAKKIQVEKERLK